MRKKLVFLMACALSFLPLHAEMDGRKVLDKTAELIQKSKGSKITFKVSTFISGIDTETGSIEGSMILQGKKFHLDTKDMLVWYDGKTQWSYMPEAGEVNMTKPSEKEMQATNPYAFISIYKKGYDISLRSSQLRNIPSYEVYLKATQEDNPTQEIYVDVRQSDFTPLCIRVRQDDEWTRISIKSYNGTQQFDDKLFTFPKEKYPDVEIIDLQ